MTEHISLIGLAVALLLPWCMGCISIHRLLTRSHQPCNWAVVIGVGYFSGLFITTLIIQLWDAANLKLNFWYIASILFSMCVIGLGIRGNNNTLALGKRNFVSGPHWQTAIIFVLIALMIWRQLTLSEELSLRPMWGWDAWMNWTPKAIVWWHNGALLDYVRPEHWLQQPDGASSHTLGNYRAWAYPPGVPLILLWSMMGADTWDHTLLYLPWILASLNLGLALWGHLKLSGSSTVAGVIACYLLLNLPFFNVHSVVAGYADIWLTSAFSLAVFALHEWHKCRHWSWGLVCVFFALMCSQLKLPGLTLTAIILVAIIRSLLNLRWRTELAIFALSLLGIAGGMLWGFNLDIPYLGNIAVHERHITTSLFWNFELEYHPVGMAYIESLLLSINWNILYYLLLPVVLVKLASKAFIKKVSNELLVLYMVAIFSILVFFFTDSYLNALDHTTLSRSLLYSVPAFIFYIFLWLSSIEDPDLRNNTI